MRKKMSEETLAKLRANIAKAREAKALKNLSGGDATDVCATSTVKALPKVVPAPPAQNSIGIVGWRRGWEKVIKP